MSSIKTLTAVLLALVAATAFAQGQDNKLGTTQHVQGLVTVTTGATGGTVANGNPILSGMRFVTSSSGTVTLEFDNGCQITLKPLEAITVDRSMNCKALLLAVQPVGGSVAGASAFTQGAFATGGLAIGAYGLHSAMNRKSISSN